MRFFLTWLIWIYEIKIDDQFNKNKILIIPIFLVYLQADSNLFILVNKGRLIYTEEGRD